MEKIKNKGHFITMGTLISIFTVITPVWFNNSNRIHNKLDELSNRPYITKSELKETLTTHDKIEPTKKRLREDVDGLEIITTGLQKDVQILKERDGV